MKTVYSHEEITTNEKSRYTSSIHHGIKGDNNIITGVRCETYVGQPESTYKVELGCFT